MKGKVTRSAALLLSLFVVPAFAQDNPRIIRAASLEQPPRIDGRLDDACWRTGTPVSGFVQFDPDNGRPASEETLVWAAFDRHHLYFAFRMNDSQPEKIWAELTPRNEYENNDSITLILDTYNDRRTSISFTVNPRGVQKNSVETIWKSAATVDDRGWTAEMAIPFKSLRFTSAPEQLWGVNVERTIQRLNETDYWTGVSRDLPLLLQLGELRGLSGVKPGANLEFFPYAGVRSSRRDGEKDDKMALGLDVKYGILPNLILDTTVSPDFSEVQSDPFLYQLSPYENYFEENRPFFAEGSQYFRLASQADEMAESGNTLFYSRRIANPRFAAKLTGKTGGWAFGLLGALNDDPGADSLFGVVRVQKDILRNSQMGLYYAGLERDGDYSRNLAVDYSFNFKEIYFVRGVSAFSFNRGSSGRGKGMHQLQFTSEPDAGLQLTADFLHVEPDVDVRTGYVSQTDLQSFGALVGYGWRLKSGFLRRFSMDIDLKLRQDASGNQTGSDATWMVFLRCLSQFGVHGSLSTGRSRYQVAGPDDTLAWTDRFIPTRSASLDISWDRGGFFKEIGVEMTLEKRGVYDDDFSGVEPGRQTTVEAELTLRPRSNIELETGLEWVRQTLDRTGRTVFDGLSYTGSLHLQFTPRLFFNGRLLGETRENQYNLDLLLGYYFGAGNVVQLSYKKSQRRESGLLADGHSITLKVSYLLRI